MGILAEAGHCIDGLLEALEDIAHGVWLAASWTEPNHPTGIIGDAGPRPRRENTSPAKDTVAVIDIETTGMSPDTGGRATEIGVVLLRDGRVVDRYESLMNAGAWVPPFIEALTGISNEMLRAAPPAARVMAEVANFVGTHPLIAHNAAFDRRFWDAELARLGRTRRQEFACTLLLSRRIHPEAPSHRLGSLIDFHGLPVAGRHHRALADAEMAASLFLHMRSTLAQRFGLADVPHALLREIQAVPRNRLTGCIALHTRAGAGGTHVACAPGHPASRRQEH